nr:MAG TPA: hypothetical protein [Caudoviricetes sp.]
MYFVFRPPEVEAHAPTSAGKIKRKLFSYL